MNQNVINFEKKRKEFRAKPYIESGLMLNTLVGILDDLKFFKKNVEIIGKSEHLFRFSMKKTKNYSKSVVIQREFVEELEKLG